MSDFLTKLTRASMIMPSLSSLALKNWLILWFNRVPSSKHLMAVKKRLPQVCAKFSFSRLGPAQQQWSLYVFYRHKELCLGFRREKLILRTCSWPQRNVLLHWAISNLTSLGTTFIFIKIVQDEERRRIVTNQRPWETQEPGQWLDIKTALRKMDKTWIRSVAELIALHQYFDGLAVWSS